RTSSRPEGISKGGPGPRISSSARKSAKSASLRVQLRFFAMISLQRSPADIFLRPHLSGEAPQRFGEGTQVGPVVIPCKRAIECRCGFREIGRFHCRDDPALLQVRKCSALED